MHERIQTRLREALSRRKKRVSRDSSRTPAAVLILIYPKEGEPHVLFTRRTEEVEHHKGEVSFPGGVQDPEDASPTETALRESQEEMGIAPEEVTLLGELDETPTGTGFLVHPVVSSIEEGYRWRPNPAEIAEVIEVPLEALMAPENRRMETRWIEGHPREFCSFACKGHLIWGATAGIVRQLVEALEASGWKGAAGEL